MAVTVRELERIRREGLKALKEKLGVEGMIKFIQMYSDGKGDYTEERREILKDLNSRLEALLEEVVLKEESDAKEWTNWALDDPDYYVYKSALEKVSVLTNESLKQDLSKKLASVKEILITQEKEYNKQSNRHWQIYYAPIVKWISHKSSKLRFRVRIPVEAPNFI